MKKSIHTAPVLEALQENDGCAFCTMLIKLNVEFCHFMLGPAYMEEDVRLATDGVGFCREHLLQMYEQQNRLGLALMLHTHVKRLCTDVGKKATPAKTARKKTHKADVSTHLAKVVGSCYICDRVEATFGRYVETFFSLWTAGGPAAKLIEEGPGFCLPHTITLMEFSQKKFGAKHRGFLDVLCDKIQDMLATLESDLEWFTLKFDHRNRDEPWKNAKDALPRAIRLLGMQHTSF